MKGNLIFAAILMLIGGASVFNYMQAEKSYERAQELIRAAEARYAQQERQRQIDEAKGAFNERAETGGDTGLSDYLRDMASELWPHGGAR